MHVHRGIGDREAREAMASSSLLLELYKYVMVVNKNMHAQCSSCTDHALILVMSATNNIALHHILVSWSRQQTCI